jgi:hypothetical protein
MKEVLMTMMMMMMMLETLLILKMARMYDVKVDEMKMSLVRMIEVLV